MIYFVDIDETICCHNGEERSYPTAQPITANIKKINELYDAGHTVVYWTARGATTGIDWSELTRQQLVKWGAKFHELRMNKPNYDLFICDKAVNTRNFFKNE